jgi:hypothetical protein
VVGCVFGYQTRAVDGMVAEMNWANAILNTLCCIVWVYLAGTDPHWLHVSLAVFYSHLATWNLRDILEAM